MQEADFSGIFPRVLLFLAVLIFLLPGCGSYQPSALTPQTSTAVFTPFPPMPQVTQQLSDTPAPSQPAKDTQSLTLSPGWSTISFPAQSVISTWGFFWGLQYYDDQGQYQSLNPWGSIPPELCRKGFWAYSGWANPAQINLSDQEGNPSLVFKSGWNLVAFPLREAKSFADLKITMGGETKTLKAASSLATDPSSAWFYGIIQYYKNDRWYQLKTDNDANQMVPWKGYWIFSWVDNAVIACGPPQVILSVPAGPDATIADSIALDATVNWTGLIAGVDFYIDDQLVETQTDPLNIADSAQFNYEAGFLNEGTHQLKAVVRTPDNLSYSSEVFSLNIHGTPLAPTDLTAQATGLFSITLNWSDPNAWDTNCLVESSTDGVNFTLAQTLPPGSTSCLLSGLQADVLYYFRVRAQSGPLYSDYSDIVTATPFYGPQITICQQFYESASYPGFGHIASGGELIGLCNLFNVDGYLPFIKGRTFGQYGYLKWGMERKEGNGNYSLIYAFSTAPGESYLDIVYPQTSGNMYDWKQSMMQSGSDYVRYYFLMSDWGSVKGLGTSTVPGAGYDGIYDKPGNLTIGQTYTYRAFVTNNVRTYYSNEASCTIILQKPVINDYTLQPDRNRLGLFLEDTADYEDYYAVERSTDGVNFTQVATMPGVAGHCYLGQTTHILFWDYDVTHGTTYTYRIKAFKGSYSSVYSDPFTVTYW